MNRHNNNTKSLRDANTLFNYNKSSKAHPIEEFFNNFAKNWSSSLSNQSFDFMPSCDFFETESDYYMFLEIPKIKKENIDISISDSHLIIKGEKKQETKHENSNKKYHHSEIQYGSFTRSLEIPHDADIDNITAELDEGTLEIKIPKTANQTNVKKVEIKENK